MLRGNPAFAVSAILLVALGVGAVTTIFTAVDHVLLRPLPYPEADRLVFMTNGSHSGVLTRELDGLQTLDTWVGSTEASVTLTSQGEPLRLTQARITEDFFPVFGATPVLGRLLTHEDRGRQDLAVVSGAAWRTIWGSDPGIVGRTIVLDGAPVTVVGVLDPDFRIPSPMVSTDAHLWTPWDWADPRLDRPTTHFTRVTARLREGTGLDAANEELAGLAERMAETYPEDYTDREGNPRRWPLVSLQSRTVSDWSRGLGLLFAAVSLLLLVACVNVAHLFLARGLTRDREISVRRALGAGTGALISQLMVEALTVGLLGGALGVLLAHLGVQALAGWVPVDLPTTGPLEVDVRILGFSLAVSVGTALVFGLLPGIKALGRDVTAGLRTATRSSTATRGMKRLRGGLVVAEIALSLILVAQAGLLLRSFFATATEDTGVETASVWVLPLSPTTPETVEEYLSLTEQLEASLAEVPGISSAARGLTMPFQFTGGDRCCWSTSVPYPGEEDRSVPVSMHPVGDAYFQTLGIEFLAGGLWPRDASRAEPLPVVVNESLAVALYGSASAALGREVGEAAPGYTIQGVVVDTRHYGLDQTPASAMYLPIGALAFNIPLSTLAVRVEDGGDGLAQRLREAVWRVDPSLPVPAVHPIEDWISGSLRAQRFGSVVSSGFGLIALLLAAGGLYGALLYSVGQRERELGIRLALGADPTRIRARILASGLRIGVMGAGIGLFGAWGLGRLLEGFLYGVQPTDPAALGGAALLLMATALAASWWPARRAAGTDPLSTLNTE
jgi:predicted permease